MEQHAVRQDDGHYFVLLEEVEAMQQEGKVSRRLRRQAVILEGHALARRFSGKATLPGVFTRREAEVTRLLG